MTVNFTQKRALSIIRDIISKLRIDLQGKNVLTEVGSDNYLYLPVIASLAGAEKVMAWTRDSSYGKAQLIIENCSAILKELGLIEKVSFFTGSKNELHLQEADIITNSGFLRPLDKDKLQHCKEGAVIPLMFEKWEIREEDLDLEYCNKKNIKVAGTWENHPSIRVFDNVGPLAIKMAMEAGFEVFANRIAVWSDDDFGSHAKKAFLDLGAADVIQTVDFSELMDNIRDLDFIFLCDYSETRNFTGNTFFNTDEIIRMNPDISIIHLYGDLSTDVLKNKGIYVYPDKKGKAKTMTYTLGHVGLKPILELQAAGLKIAELVGKNISSDLVQPVNF